MITSIQLTFPFPVKQCLNISRELKKLNVDNIFTTRHRAHRALPGQKALTNHTKS